MAAPLSDRELLELLRGVSRSFVITIRALPKGLRRPIGTAYLLARASDTIADTPTAPARARIEMLHAFCHAVEQGEEAPAFDLAPEKAAEDFLLQNLGRVLAVMRDLPQKDRREIVALLQKITHGQSLDLTRFPEPESLHALATAAELDEYTYLVAGCVGEFWTRVCHAHLPGYGRLPLEELCRLGRGFGQGLQLVNILRDLPEDLRNGRCYLPLDELAAAGVADPAVLRENPGAAAHVFETWRRKALAHHGEARAYIEAIRPWRVRFACLVPWALGVRTLELLRERSPLRQAARVKVSRAEVRRILRRAVWAACSNGEIERWAREMTGF